MTREEAIIILDCERPYGNCGCGASDEEIEEALNIAIKELEQEPILEKTGQWWERNTYPQESRSWDCSECQEIVFEKTNYCPSCGAKMEV